MAALGFLSCLAQATTDLTIHGLLKMVTLSGRICIRVMAGGRGRDRARCQQHDSAREGSGSLAQHEGDSSAILSAKMGFPDANLARLLTPTVTAPAQLRHALLAPCRCSGGCFVIIGSLAWMRGFLASSIRQRHGLATAVPGMRQHGAAAVTAHQTLASRSPPCPAETGQFATARHAMDPSSSCQHPTGPRSPSVSRAGSSTRACLVDLRGGVV
jgi:hypothetical protein